MDNKFLRQLIFGAAGCIILAWLLIDTQRVLSLLRGVWNILMPFVLGAGIAFVFNVPLRAVERQLEGIHKPGLRRGIAIVVTIGLLILIIAFVVELLVPQIRMTFESLIASLKVKIPEYVTQVSAFLDENPEIEDWVMTNVLQPNTDLESLDWASLIQKALSVVGNSVSTILGGTFNAIGSVTSGLVNVFISVCFALYALARKEILARQGRQLLYAFLPEKTADEIVRIMRLTNTTFSNFISGQCLEAIILGSLFAVAMLIFGMPYIPLVSVVIAVTALVPIVGAFVGCAIGAFFILVESPVQALTFVVMFLVLQQIEGNVIYPRVVGTSVGLPGMWVLAAVTVGGELMGVAGMLIMIPLTSVLYALLREITNKRIQERNIPQEKLQIQPPGLQSHFSRRREQKNREKQRKLRDKLIAMQKHKKP